MSEQKNDDRNFWVGYLQFSCHRDNLSDNNQEYWYPWSENGFEFEDKGYRTAEACELAMRRQLKIDMRNMLKELREYEND
jgi:hypothetical protein